MDCSVEYIEMCRKAVEVQEVWKVKTGDYCTHPDGEWADTKGLVCGGIMGSVHVLRNMAGSSGASGFHYTNYEIFNQQDCVWLPRQDQLQDMIPNEPAWDYRFSKFSNWVDTELGMEVCNSVDSMEQLWLAFVMNELYQKKWNGKEWVI